MRKDSSDEPFLRRLLNSTQLSAKPPFQTQQLTHTDVLIYSKYRRWTLSDQELQLWGYQLSDPDYEKSVQGPLRPLKEMILALDCEMVQSQKNQNQLARCTIVDFEGRVLLDTFVKPQSPVLDYRTVYSGVRDSDLEGAPSADEVRRRVLQIVTKDSLLIGHSLQNDLSSLRIIHRNIIDTSVLYAKHGYKQKLKFLALNKLNLTIQTSEHDSVADARAALALAKLKAEMHFLQEGKPKNDILRQLIHRGNSVLLMDQESRLEEIDVPGVHKEEFPEETSVDDKIKKFKVRVSGQCMLPKLTILDLQALSKDQLQEMLECSKGALFWLNGECGKGREECSPTVQMIWSE